MLYTAQFTHLRTIHKYLAVFCFWLLLLLVLIVLTGCKKTEKGYKKTEKPQGKETLESHNPIPLLIHPELPGRPAKETMTVAQKKFWDYLESLTHLQDKPTSLMKKIIDGKGVAPDFIYLSTSKSSVFGNIEGAMDHREIFAERYPWVKRLLHKYNITLMVSEDLFTGNAEKTLVNYMQYIQFDITLNNRARYSKQWLECLLILDYLFAHGSMEDRNNGLKLMHHIFHLPATRYDSVQKLKELGIEMEVPASRDIAMALIDDFSEDIWEQTITFPLLIFEHCDSLVDFMNYSKWVLRVEAFKKWENTMDVIRIQVGNFYVSNGLMANMVYWYHCKDPVRPDKKSQGVAIKQFFKMIYQKKYQGQYNKYKQLLDTAYPPN